MTTVDRSTPQSPGPLARVAPLASRLRTETGGAGLLLAGTLAALIWANSPWGQTYDDFWHTELAFRVAGFELALDLQHWVNDGLMTFFFFVVGLEVKRELVLGELADRRRAAVPALAALAGLAVPAVIYVLFNLGDEAAAAWGVVISTDTAFLLGILALLGSACPPPLRVFLLALAIGDDVGALTVIAIFYTEDLALVPLAVAVLGFGLMLALKWLRVWRGPAYLVLGVGVWVALYLSGVHPTLLGVAVALATPAYAPRRTEVDDAARRARAYVQSPSPQAAVAARLSIERSVPPGERLQRLWQPWSSAVFVPLFALANAGVPLTAETLRAAVTSPITLGVVAGLVVGKLLGISLGTALAVRLGLGELAPGLTRLQVTGGAVLSGIGFTISLFIVDLAFTDEALADQARVGVLAASVLASLLGVGLLRLAARGAADPDSPYALDPPVDPDRDHIRGPVDAPLTLVEYGDFECPFCGRATGAVSDLRERLGDRLRYVFRHAPISDRHPHAQLAAEAAEAAGAQGRFWDMHDRMFATQDRLTTSDLLEHAADLGLDVARFARDLGSGRHATHVRHDVESAEASGVPGTPTFFVGERRHDGPTDADSLAEALLGEAGLRADEDETAGRARASFFSRPAPSAGPSRDEGSQPAALPDLPEDLPETPERDGDQPRLTEDQLDRLASAGSRRTVARGDILYRAGDTGYDFHVVVSGAVAVVGYPRGTEPVIRVHGARRFLGAFDVFKERRVVRTAVVIRAGEVIRLTADELRALLDADADLREVVQRAYLVRLALAAELSADLRILGRSSDPDTRRLRAWAEANRRSADVIDLDAAEDADGLLEEVGVTESDLPVVITRTGQVLRNPDDHELAASVSPT